MKIVESWSMYTARGAYEVEFMTSAGETTAVVTALEDQLTQPHGQANGSSDVQA